MPGDKMGVTTGITAKLESRDEEGEVKKTTYFFPDLDVSVEAANVEEAKKLAEEKAAKIKKSQK